MSNWRNEVMKAARRTICGVKPTRGHKCAWQGKGQKTYASDALGVHPSQIKEATENLRRHGVMADFAPDGRCIITSPKQFKEVAKASGLFNGREGYLVTLDSGAMVATGRKREAAKERFKKTVSQWDE